MEETGHPGEPGAEEPDGPAQKQEEETNDVRGSLLDRPRPSTLEHGGTSSGDRREKGEDQRSNRHRASVGDVTGLANGSPVVNLAEETAVRLGEEFFSGAAGSLFMANRSR